MSSINKLSVAAPLILAALTTSGLAQARTSPIPSLTVPNALGVNIHFTDPRPGEMKMLAAGGFRWVRMDFAWDATERSPGRYDFSAYDRLMKSLKPYGIRALFILDYSNRLYDEGLSPHTEAGRQAFARWAAAAVRHFHGQNILWEMYNEPNGSFWKPRANVDQYAALALAVGKAIRSAAPGETYIGPATSGMDFGFLEACFKAGLLRYWTAVSVHPYRQDAPETAAGDYRTLRQLIREYAPRGKVIPIISGEWGYSSVWGGENEEKQGRMLPREWLSNLSSGIAISIWYDWHDDGLSPTDPEAHFGTVHNPYHPGQDPVYEPKPSYLAARTLTRVLNGYHFNKRLDVGDPDDYLLLFTKGQEERLVAWTTRAAPHSILIPASPGVFDVAGHLGSTEPAVTATSSGLSFTVTDAPHYLAPRSSNALLELAADWARLPLDLVGSAPGQISIRFRLPDTSHPLSLHAEGERAETRLEGDEGVLTVPTFQQPQSPRIRVTLNIAGVGSLSQSAWLVVTNPIRVSVLPAAGRLLQVQVENPSGRPLDAVLSLSQTQGVYPVVPGHPLHLAQGQLQTVVPFDLKDPAAADYSVGVRIDSHSGQALLRLPPVSFHPLDDFSRYPAGQAPPDYQVVPDGDAAVGSRQSLSIEAPAAGPPLPGLGVLKIQYEMDPGWKFIRLVPTAAPPIPPHTHALGLWVYCDGHDMLGRMRFVDSTGQTFQPDAGLLPRNAWKYVLMALDNPNCGHWGGANDGVIHYPIRFDSLFLLDNSLQEKNSGSVYLSAPTLEVGE